MLTYDILDRIKELVEQEIKETAIYRTISTQSEHDQTKDAIGSLIGNMVFLTGETTLRQIVMEALDKESSYIKE